VVEFTQRKKASGDDDDDGGQQAEPQTTVVDKGKQKDVADEDEEEEEEEGDDEGQALPPLNRKPVQLALEKDKLALGQAPLRYGIQLLLEWCNSCPASHVCGRFPHGVAVDREGDRMFIADSGHHRILVLSTVVVVAGLLEGLPPEGHSEDHVARLQKRQRRYLVVFIF
jgi:DNA-binding beta-propeller fold protein YncE